jgi:DNA-directed RNA polymerase specialized sigma subunit
MTKSAMLNELDASIAEREKDLQYINKLNKTKDKVKYLRLVKNYTQINAAEIIGISLRQVQRIEKILKKI